MKVETRFDESYNAPDPRQYYDIMRGVDYRNAAYSVPVFAAALREVMRLRGLRRARVLDLACGYGIVSALLRHDAGLAEILARYGEPALRRAPVSELIAMDRAWFKARRRPDPAVETVGLDIARNALAYGHAVGLFDEIHCEDLDEALPSEGLHAALRDCTLVVEAGSIAHMQPGILRRLLGAVEGRKPWVVTAPVRGNDSAEALKAMEDAGLVVEPVPLPPFPVRRFADAGERARALEQVRTRGHDPEGFETEGCFHGCLYLARPAEEATTPAGELLRETHEPAA